MILPLKYFAFFLLFICFSACSDSSENQTLKDFQKNHFSFTKFQAVSYKGIQFKIPRAFQLFQSNDLFLEAGRAWKVEELGLFFTVEKLNRTDFEAEISKNEDEEIRAVDIAHSFYFNKRSNSVVNRDFSNYLRGENIRFETAMNHLIGRKPYENNDLHYDLLTLEKGNKYFVFQLISNEELSKYVLDDFNKIIKSVR